MFKGLHRVQPGTLLRVQVFAVAITAAAGLAFFLFAVDFVRGRLEDSSGRTTAALLAFRVHDELSQSLDILGSRAEGAIDDRPVADRIVLRQSLLGPEATSTPLELKVPLSLKETAVLQSNYDSLVNDARHLFAQSGQPPIQTLLFEIESLNAPINAYLDEPTGRNFRNLYAAISVVESDADRKSVV